MGRATFNIMFKDLIPEAQTELLTLFRTTEEDENWNTFPLAVLEREMIDSETD